jgi:TetR/AcrR family transcriptional repressor of nem operon
MRYAKEHKAETKQKILTAAARLFREFGYDGVGVDAIMAEAGLTAGGFYAHFPSKQALFAEALVMALEPKEPLWATKNILQSGEKSLRLMINSYLSRTHRSRVAEGCPLPVLTPDVARADQSTRANYEEKLLQILREIESFLTKDEPARPASKDTALALLAQLVGGLMLARAVNDEQLSDRILKACRQAALKISED